MSEGLKVSARAMRGEVLPSTMSIDASYTGDDADWDGTPGQGGNDQWKQPVRVATTASVTIASALNSGDTLDGVTLATGDRVLVKDQGTASQNGIYIVGTTPARADDLDEDDEVLGAVVYVLAGTANAGTAWAVTNTTAPDVDTDAINWAAFGGGGGSGDANIYDATWFDVTAYGATGDGTTDDTSAIQDAIDAAEAAGGGVVYFPAGVYAVSGALADTSRSNSQLVLPIRHTDDDEQLTIELRGPQAPAAIPAVVGTIVDPDLGAVIKGTLSSVSGTSPAMLGGWGPSGSYEDFTMVRLVLRDLTFRLPSNPVYTALNLSHVEAVDLDNVIVDVGEYTVQSLTEPTTTTSYGIRLPALNNGAYTRLGAVNVVGYYYGIQAGEHTVGEIVSLWGCKRAVEFVAAYHASHFDRLMTVHCEQGLVFTGGAHYFTIDQFNVEHAASGWWVTDYDVNDASNYGYGHGAWKVTLAGTGHDSTFTINGGSNQHWLELGTDPYGGALDYGEDGDISTLDYGDTAAGGASAEVARADHVHGMPAATGARILLADGRSTPFDFTDLLQADDGSDFLWTD